MVMIDRQDTLELLRRAQKDVKAVPTLRLGQALFNRAVEQAGWIVRLAGSDVDPFYDDTKIWAFLDKLEEFR